MATLLIAKNSMGKIIGRCNAKCYNATDDRCFCICGGTNHKIGLRLAAKNALNQQTPVLDHIPNHQPTHQVTLKKHPNLSRYAHPTLFPTGPHE